MLTWLFCDIKLENYYSLLSVAVIDNHNQKQLGRKWFFSFLFQVAVCHRDVRIGAKAGAEDGNVEERCSLVCSSWLLPENMPGLLVLGWHCPQ